MQIHRRCEQNSRAACSSLMTEGITEFVEQIGVESCSKGGSARDAQCGNLWSDTRKCRTTRTCGSVGHGDRRDTDPFDAVCRPHRGTRCEERLFVDGQLGNQLVDVTHASDSSPSHAELGVANCCNLVLGPGEFDLCMGLAPVEKEDDLGCRTTKGD